MRSIFCLLFFIFNDVYAVEIERNIEKHGCINEIKKTDNSEFNIKIDVNKSVCADQVIIEKKIEIKEDIAVKKKACISIGNVGRKSGC